MEGLVGLDRKALDRARLSRDPRFDGKFFIAVISTGVYCRPVCPVPSPKRANVRYYASAAAAAEAGFRPCLRCRPETAPGTPAWLGSSALVRRGLRLIQDGLLDEWPVEELAARLGIGARHLHRLFVRHVGASPVTVAQTRRLHFAKHLLDETDLRITDVALAAGFGSLRRFNETFRRTYRRSPRELRGGRRGLPIPGGGEVVLRLSFRPPYDWPQLRDFLAARSAAGVERVDADGYSRSVSIDGGHALVRLRALDGARSLELRVQGAAPAALFELATNARRAFDLAADPARIALAFRADALLGPLVKRRPGLRIPGAWSAFECAVRAVLGQQVSVAAARTLAGRLVARVGRRIADDGAGLSRLFPTPEALVEADLEGLGLTGGRIEALRALGRAVLDGVLDFDAPIEDVKEALVALPGLGRWTAEYVALRALADPDAFPAGDLVLRRAAAAGGAPLEARALEARAEAWRPWRSYAAVHLWLASSDVARGAGTGA